MPETVFIRLFYPSHTPRSRMFATAAPGAARTLRRRRRRNAASSRPLCLRRDNCWRQGFRRPRGCSQCSAQHVASALSSAPSALRARAGFTSEPRSSDVSASLSTMREHRQLPRGRGRGRSQKAPNGIVEQRQLTDRRRTACAVFC